MPPEGGSAHELDQEPPSEDALAVYLRGHVAGSHGAEAIARRLQERSDDPGLRDFLGTFVEDVTHERDLVEELLGVVEGSAGLIRRGVSAVADAATRLGGSISHELSPGPAADLEALAIGVWGKRLLWGALATLAEVDPRLVRFPVASLTERATDHERMLLRFRRETLVSTLLPGRARAS